MRFILKGPLKDNFYNLMRKVGYHFLRKDEKTGKMSFVSLIEGDNFPRFHIYLKVENENLVLDLHLDQKNCSYEGTPAHSGEYDGEVVSKEAERIKQTLQEIK